MNKKILKIIISVVMCICVFTGCGGNVNYYDRIDTVVELSEHAQTLYNDGKLDLTEKISQKNVSQYCDENNRLYEILNSDNEFGDYYVVMISEDIVLVRVDELFGEAEGFIVNLGEETLGDTYSVPEELGFEDNKLNLITVDNYQNVYTFRAKL